MRYEIRTVLRIVLLGWFVSTAHAHNQGCIQVAQGYELQKVMATAFGLPFQTALLPDGSLVLTDPNNLRIIRIRENTITTLVAGSDIQPHIVASLPDGKVVYGTRNGQIKVLDISSGASQSVGVTPAGEWINALATDPIGNIYFATSKRNLFRVNPLGNVLVATNLPFDDIGYAIHDVDVANDGTVYVAGMDRVVAIDQTGHTTIIADGLNHEPVWVEVAPNNTVYINDQTRGIVPLIVIHTL